MSPRQLNDSLAFTSQPRWLKVFDKHFVEMTRRALPPWHDLAAELKHEANQWARQGWNIEEVSGRNRVATFFMNCAGDRRMISIVSSSFPASRP
jgi:hypothetical protein